MTDKFIDRRTVTKGKCKPLSLLPNSQYLWNTFLCRRNIYDLVELVHSRKQTL